MNIMSGHSDYYDGYMNHDRKDMFNKVWKRYYKKTDINVNKVRIFEERAIRLGLSNWRAAYVIVAGKVYPIVIFESYREVRTYFDADSAYKAYSKAVKEDRWEATRWRWISAGSKSYFVDFFNFRENYTNLCIELETPIIFIEPNENYYKERHSSIRKVKVNVNLKRLGFSKLYKSYTIYQTLDVFVSNVLVNDNMPDTTPMTEKQKMGQHGFDPNYGFKTRPKKQGVR